MNRQVDVKAILSHIVRGDGINKCRICMGETTEGQVHLSDTVMMDGDKPITLSELLEIITGIQVQLEDDMPSVLCPACYSSAANAASFRIIFHQAINYWDNTIQLLTALPSQCSGKTVLAIMDNTQMIIINDGANSLPSVSTSALTTSTETKLHNNIRCPYCGKIFTHATQLHQHLKESTDFKRACHICAKVMSRKALVLHMTKTHNKRMYECKRCPALLQSSDQFRQHLILAHSKGSCTCIECGCTFQSLNAFNGHVSVHRARTCPVCDKLFRNYSCFLHHIKCCCKLGEGKDFSKKKTIVEVKNRNSGKKVKVGLRGSINKECVCDYCNKKFAGKKFVAAHIQIVHLRNTHRPCIRCGKLLAAAHMSEHVKRHLLSRSFTCEDCGLVLKSRLGFIQHRRLHTGEKPYTCEHCGESFSGSSRRSAHVRKVHSTSEIVNRHVCEFCSATFPLPYRLRKHLRTVHSGQIGPLKLYECSVCNEKFGSRPGLLHHSRTHQKVDFPRRKLDRMPKFKINDHLISKINE